MTVMHSNCKIPTHKLVKKQTNKKQRMQIPSTVDITIFALIYSNCLRNKLWSNLRKAGQNYSCPWEETCCSLQHGKVNLGISCNFSTEMSFSWSTWQRFGTSGLICDDTLIKAHCLHPLAGRSMRSLELKAFTSSIELQLWGTSSCSTDLPKDRKANLTLPSSQSGLKTTTEITDLVNLFPAISQG